MKLDYFTIENLEINQNSFFYNIMNDLSQEEKEEQRYFEISGVEQFTNYKKQKNFFIRIQNHVDQFVKKKTVKKLRSVFKFIEVIQKYCLNIEKVIEIVKDIRLKIETKNFKQQLLVDIICEQNFKEKLSFRFLKEFVSPFNILFFYRGIQKIAWREKNYKFLDSFKQQFGGCELREFRQPPSFFYNNFDAHYYTLEKQLYVKNFLYPSQEQPLILINTAHNNCYGGNSYYDFDQTIFFFGKCVDDISACGIQAHCRELLDEEDNAFQYSYNRLHQNMLKTQENYNKYMETERLKKQQINDFNQKQKYLTKQEILENKINEINEIINPSLEIVFTNGLYYRDADIFIQI